MSQENIIRRYEIPQKFGVSSTTVSRWQQDPDFPDPIPLGVRAIGFEYDSILEFLRKKYGHKQAS